MYDPIGCFDYVGADYSYEQCAADYRAYMDEFYADEIRHEAMKEDLHG